MTLKSDCVINFAVYFAVYSHVYILFQYIYMILCSIAIEDMLSFELISKCTYYYQQIISALFTQSTQTRESRYVTGITQYNI